MLLVVEEHQILALENEERLGRVPMTMERRAEPRRLILGLQHGQVARRLVAVCEHDGLEVAQVQQSALVRKNDESSVHVPELQVREHASNSQNEVELRLDPRDPSPTRDAHPPTPGRTRVYPSPMTVKRGPRRGQDLSTRTSCLFDVVSENQQGERALPRSTATNACGVGLARQHAIGKVQCASQRDAQIGQSGRPGPRPRSRPLRLTSDAADGMKSPRFNLRGLTPSRGCPS